MNLISDKISDLTSPSPFQGEGGVGVTLGEKVNPHPNLPPKRGKEFASQEHIIYKHQARNQKLIKHSRRLRKDMTDVERKLWWHLRHEQLGVKFRRQYPAGHYIVDFVCLEKCLIIELDGGQHAEQKKYDTKRDNFFIQQGFKVLRFWNNEIMQNMDGVLQVIVDALKSFESEPLSLTLPHKGRENLES